MDKESKADRLVRWARESTKRKAYRIQDIIRREKRAGKQVSPYIRRSVMRYLYGGRAITKHEAVHFIEWTGDNLREVIKFTGRHPSSEQWTWEHFEEVVQEGGLKIWDHAGVCHRLVFGDFLLKDLNGNLLVCPHDILVRFFDVFEEKIT